MVGGSKSDRTGLKAMAVLKPWRKRRCLRVYYTGPGCKMRPGYLMKTTRLNRVCSTPLLPKFDLLKLLVLYCGIFGPLAGQVKFTKIYTFPTGTGSPTTGLVQGSDGGLYGASGPLGGPTTGIFKIGPNGIFSNLFSFPPGDNFGGQIYQSLFQANDGNFYGTTVGGGSGPTQYGTIFRCTPAGVSAGRKIPIVPDEKSPTPDKG
jgi:uncharacterized repeat protein (TIGR03803 family)